MVDEKAVQGTTPSRPAMETALGGAAYALEMCGEAHDVGIACPDALAKAAIIAYLNFTGRAAEAEALSHVGT